MPDGDKAGSCRCSEKDYRYLFFESSSAACPPASGHVDRCARLLPLKPKSARLPRCTILFYVSPATYGLADNVTTDEKGIERKATLPGDEV